MTALAAYGLTKRYGSQVAVDNLNLSVRRGELYGFLGPNGAGKTTTIRMLLGLILPTEGRAEVSGEPVVVAGAGTGRALRRVGALVEEPGAWRTLTGRRNLVLFAQAAGPPDDRAARLGRVDEVLSLVGLTAAAGKKVKAYSQGMRQRLGIALALLGAPDVLVLDEPTNGLDPQGIREIRLLLRRLADEGTCVFVSSHLLSEVETMCDRVGVLLAGRLVAEGAPHELRPSGGRLRVVVDDRWRALRVLDDFPAVRLDGDAPSGVSDGADAGTAVLRLHLGDTVNAAELNAALVRSGVGVSALGPEQERLEDVFLSLTDAQSNQEGPTASGPAAEPAEVGDAAR